MLGSLIAVAAIDRACVAPHDKYDFCDATLPLNKRVDDLISRLTLDEKPTLLIARNSPNGNVSRLGIPEYDWGGNCIHGVQSRCSPDGRCPTSFPNPNALGASFNKSAWRGMGEVIGLELRSLWLQGIGENHDSNLPHIGLDCWSPNIGIVRDPRWGRNLETPSEDPAVCGSFGVQITKGLQESPLDPRFVQAVVTLKHFDANSLEGDWGEDGKINRHTVDSQISDYDLSSTYLPAFKQSVIEGDALGVMCSYNAINGVPSCANDWLLGDMLRGEWNFSGYVSSDSGAVVDIYQNHHYTSNWTQTVSKALHAGCDIESAPWPPDHAYATGGPYIEYGPAAVRSGELDEKDMDAALRRSVGLRFRLGLFDPIDDQPLWHVPPSVVQADKHVAAAIDATQQSLVLLLNGVGVGHEGRARGGARAASTLVLPFTAGGKVAVIGPHANDHTHILGNYLGQICNDGFSSRSCVVSPFEAIAAVNGKGTTSNASGCGVNTTDASGIAAALAVAHDADSIVFVGGLDTSTVEREGKDRHEIGLPGLQPSLLAQLLALGKPLAFVLFHGGIVTFPADLLAQPNLALVSAGYPGLYGAAAIADALFDVPASDGRPARQASNRWGKTPITWYSEGGWKDAAFDMLSFDMALAPGRTHRYYTGTAQWPFGAGLSYASTSTRAASTASTTAANAPTIDVAVRNEDAARATDQIVFLYARAVAGTIAASEPAARLRRTLVAFERLGPIAPGATARASFVVTPRMLEVHDAHGKAKLHPGSYDFLVGAGDDEVSLGFECSEEACRPSA